MFNRGTTTGLFGTANTSFGATSNAFGTNAVTPFSAGTATGAFGSTGFGSQTPSLFGAPAAAAPSATGGLFGSSAIKPTTGFSFGQSVATVQPTVQGGGLFGSASSGFGTTTSTAQPSLFSNPAASGGLFGGTSIGGGTVGIGGFGATAQPATGTVVKFVPVNGTDVMMKNNAQATVQTKLQCITGMKEYENKSLEELRLEDYAANRKAPQQQTGLFLGAGSTAASQQSTGFGGFTGFGVAASSGQTAAPSLFGQPSMQAPTLVGSGAGGLFGSSAQAKPLFGAATTTTTSSLFGGAATGGLLNAGSTGGLFGQSTPNKSIFGATTTTQSGGLFGTSTLTQPAGGLFGAPATGSSLFGGAVTPAASSIGGFGTPFVSTAQPAAGGLFGQQQQKNIFGQPLATSQPTASLGFSFGAATQAQPLGTAGSLFGKPLTSNASLSLATPASNTAFGFGATSTGQTLGGTPSMFNTGGTSLFNTGGTTGTSLFGQSQPTAPLTGFSFGNTTNILGGTMGVLGGTTMMPGTMMSAAVQQPDAAALAQQQMLLQHQKEVLASSPYGDSPLFRNLKQSDPMKREALLKPTNPAAQKATLAAGPQFRVQSRSAAKMKPQPLHSIVAGKGQLFDGLEDEELGGGGYENSSTFMPRRSVKKLVLKPGGGGGGGREHPPPPGSRSTSLSLSTDPHNLSGSPYEVLMARDSNISSVSHGLGSSSSGGGGSGGLGGGGRGVGSGGVRGGSDERIEDRHQRDNNKGQQGRGGELDNTVGELNVKNRVSAAAASTFDPYRQASNVGVVSSGRDVGIGGLVVPNGGRDSTVGVTGVVRDRSRHSSVGGVDTGDDVSNNLSDDYNAVPHPAGIVLHRAGYFTLPSLDELVDMVDSDGQCLVENFVVGREGYGNVVFPGITNVAGLNLDEIVHFRSKEIDIYPNDENKPPLGEGLNRRAQVTLDRVWPSDKTTGDIIKDYDRLMAINYMDRIEKASAKIGAKFIEYRPETGSWVFEVKHFSKYRLIDDDEDDDDDPNLMKQKIHDQEQLQQQQFDQQQQQLNKDDQQIKSAAAEKTSVAKSLESSHVMTGLGGVMTSPSKPVTYTVDDDNDACMVDDIMKERFPSNRDRDADDECYSDADMEMTECCLAKPIGVSGSQVQIQKASFFGSYFNEEEEEEEEGKQGRGGEDDDEGDTMEGGDGQYLKQKKRKSTRTSGWTGVGSMFGDVGGDRMTGGNKSLLAGGRVVGLNETSVSRKDRMSQLQSTGKFRESFDRSSNMNTSSSFALPPPPAASPSLLPRTHTPHIPQPTLSLTSYPLIPSGMPVETRPRPVAGCRILRAVPFYDKSVLADRQDLSLDIGLMMGRSFRVGWTNNLTLCHVGGGEAAIGRKSTVFRGRGPSSQILGVNITTVPSSLKSTTTSTVTTWQRIAVESVDVNKQQPAIALLREYLQTTLSHSVCTTDDGFPLFFAVPGLDLLNAYNCLNNNKTAVTNIGLSLERASIWSLCHALWGDVQAMISTDDEKSNLDYITQLARREAVSLWLTDVTRQVISAETAACSKDTASTTFSYLSGRLISEACESALSCKDLHLALLIAQSVGSDDVRMMLRRQLAAWATTKMDQFIDSARMRIISLLSGAMVWRTSSGEEINVCAQLDWKRCFALHLWYKCAVNSSVSEALGEYELACCTRDADDSDVLGQRYVALPTPEYLERLGVEEARVQDVTYHLLKLYTEPSHPLYSLLNPTTMTDDPLDYSLTWHLLSVLTSLGYDKITDECRSIVCTSYACQLEAAGLYPWAVFVLLHIRDPTSRKDAVLQLLMRHVEVGGNETDESERELAFMIDRLQVPPQWIHQAKAVRARYSKSSVQEAWHLLKAELWNDCHNVVIKEISSQAIVNNNAALLLSYLEPLRDASDEICDWLSGGQLYLDYFETIRLAQFFEETVEEESRECGGERASDYDLERIHSLCISVARRTAALPCPNTIDRQSLEELTSMRLPEDYALDALAQVSQILLHAIHVA